MKVLKKPLLLSALLLTTFFLTSCQAMVLLIGTALSEEPPKPKIQTGEFPFEITYKLDGKLYTVQDVYVCNYDGIGLGTAHGKYRKWTGYIKGSGESAIFITEDSDRKIFCFVGDAEFYMNDERYYHEQRPLTPRLYNVTKDPINTDSLNQDEIEALYNIEIVSWKFSDPVENSFE